MCINNKTIKDVLEDNLYGYFYLQHWVLCNRRNKILFYWADLSFPPSEDFFALCLLMNIF